MSSITAYYEVDSDHHNYSMNPDPVSTFTPHDRIVDSAVFSQELRLAGKTGRLNWQVGAFYYSDRQSRTDYWTYDYGIGTNAYDRWLQNPNGPQRGMGQNTVFELSKLKSYAFFGQATYSLTDWLDVTGGLRYTNDSKRGRSAVDGTPATFFLAPSTLPFNVRQTYDHSETTPMVTVSSDLGAVGPFDNLFFYGTYAKGYKAGGYQAGTSPQEAAASIAPESAESYEIGFKSRLWDRRLLFNMTGYTVTYQNLQQFIASTQGISIQTADASVDGLEVEINLVPVENLQLGVAYAYMKGKYGAGSIIDGTDVGGNHLIQTPRNNLNLSLNYSQPIFKESEISLLVNYGYKSGVYFQPANNFENLNNNEIFNLTQESILNANISIEHGNWTFSIWGNNLLEDKVVLRAVTAFRRAALTTAEINAGANSISGKWGTPRTFGGSVAWKF